MKGYVPDPILSAQRNLRDRIEAFNPGRGLTPFEELQVEKAREALSSGLYRLGEEFMLMAERSDLFGPK